MARRRQPTFVDPTGQQYGTRKEYRQARRSAVQDARKEGGKKAAVQTRRDWRRARRRGGGGAYEPEAEMPPGGDTGGDTTYNIFTLPPGEKDPPPQYNPGSFEQQTPQPQVTDRSRLDLANQIGALV
jgi:hypothetical protein